MKIIHMFLMLRALSPAAVQVDMCEAGQRSQCCNVSITNVSKHQLQLLQPTALHTIAKENKIYHFMR